MNAKINRFNTKEISPLLREIQNCNECFGILSMPDKQLITLPVGHVDSVKCLWKWK